jgi:hypothetical protein
MLNLNLNVKGEVEFKGGNTSLSGSPTTTVKQHVIRALYDGTLLSKITKIVLVDTDGTERDSTTSLSYSVSGNKLTITCNISITASYTIGKVRSYAGTNLYFETTPSTQTPVNSGDTVNVSLEITASISGTLVYGDILISLSMVDFGNLVCNVLAGNITPDKLNISTIVFIGSVKNFNVTPSKTLSSDGLKVSFSGSVTSDTTMMITAIKIQAPANILWQYTGLDVGIYAGDILDYSEDTGF